MQEIGILFLPSGPGLNSGPARRFLEKNFAEYGKAVFWNEPSPHRGDSIPENSRDLINQIFASIEGVVRSLPDRFVIVTESFGSLVAEVFFEKSVRSGKLRSGQSLLGILHTPPILDLEGALRLSLKSGESDFLAVGQGEDAQKLREVQDSGASIGTEVFGNALDLAYSSGKLLPRYFASEQGLMEWAKGFEDPRFHPDSKTRTRILQAFLEEGLPLKTTLSPDVPTWIFAGAKDPYRVVQDFYTAVEAAKKTRPRTHEIRFFQFETAHHYPYIDDPIQWKSLFKDFMKACS